MRGEGFPCAARSRPNGTTSRSARWPRVRPAKLPGNWSRMHSAASNAKKALLLMLLLAVSLTPPRAGAALPGEKKLMNELLESAFDAYVDENYEKAIVNFEK